jgi:hypothetical protein
MSRAMDQAEQEQVLLGSVRAGSIQLDIIGGGPRRIQLAISGPHTRNGPFTFGLWVDELDALIATLRSARAGLKRPGGQP